MSERPLWQPRTEAELLSALTNGLLVETHTLDLKRELPAKSKNKDLAKDLASFALDGGTIMVGIDEGSEEQPPSLVPQPLAGARERVEQIGLMAVDEPLRVTTTEIRSEDDPSRGYLVVRVPASPRAPHAVDGKFYARGDSTNRVLPPAEVRRYHELAVTNRTNLVEQARSWLATFGHDKPLLVAIAEPDGLREQLLAGQPPWTSQLTPVAERKVCVWAFRTGTASAGMTTPRRLYSTKRDVSPSLRRDPRCCGRQTMCRRYQPRSVSSSMS